MHFTRFLIVLALLGLAAGTAVPAELKVSNRAPAPEEWGYRPADGSAARMNPPSLTWIHEQAAAAYTVQIANNEKFADAITAGPLPFNTYTHNKPLAPGNYFWRYQFADKTGQRSGWSQVRRFSVGADSIEFPMPSRAEQAERVPKQHPRLFMRPEELPRLRAAVKTGETGKAFAAIKKQADRLLKQKPTPEPKVKASSRDDATRKYWWPNRETALKAGDECEILAFTWLMTQDPKYGKAARQYILAYAAWDPAGPTNFSLNDEAAFPVLYKLPRAYDWAYGALTEADRAKVRQTMIRRATDAWKSGQVGYGTGHLNKPYNSHANRCWHKLAECAIACYGDVPQAADWLDYAVNKFYAAYPVWADDDGGWHEGASYSSGYMVKAVWWMHIARNTLQIDPFKKPYFAQVGDFLMYMAPPGSPNMGMGDLSWRPSKGYGWLHFFARAMNGENQHGKYWEWLLDQYRTGDVSGVIGLIFSLNMPALPKPQAPTDLPQSKVFHGIGQASLHATLLDSARDVHFHFKSSPMGSQSHGHNPQNSFQLSAYGETLLPACTYRDYHGSPFHYKWVHQTSSQNAVLVDGKGQVTHTASPLGKIVADSLTPTVDYVAGDATAAYDGRLDRYVRHVVFIKPDLIVMYDDLAAKAPATFQFMLHGYSPFKMDEAAGELKEERPKAGVTVRYLAPAGLGLGFKQTDGFNPKPTVEFPNLWHVEAGTKEARKEIGMLTVLAPAKAGEEKELKTERVESATALGVKMSRDGKTVTVAFRKPGVTGTAELQGLKFEGAFGVK